MTRRMLWPTIISLAITFAVGLTRLALGARHRLRPYTLADLDLSRVDPCDVRLARLSAEATMLRAAGR